MLQALPEAQETSLCMQEGAEAAQGPADMKQAAAQLWGNKAWRQRSLKPDALSEWQGRCDKVAAQVATSGTQPGASGSRPARGSKAGEPENGPRGRSFPAAEKPSSPYASLVRILYLFYLHLNSCAYCRASLSERKSVIV